MRTWNNHLINQRWLRITLFSCLLVSIFLFLGTQSEIFHWSFEKISSQDIVGNKGSKSVEEKLTFLDTPLILDGSSAEEQPVDLGPSSTVEKLAVPTSSPVKEELPVKEKPLDGKPWEGKPVDATPSTPETAPEEIPVEETIAQENPFEPTPPIPTPPPYELATEEISEDAKKYAYLIFTTQGLNASDDLEKDNYFIAARILVWQLVHNLSTRTKHDVIVMVTPNFDLLHTPNDGWLKPTVHRWDDVTTKMRAWELVQYDRILMLDADSMLLKLLDPVLLDDPAVHLLATKPSNTTLPSTYLVAFNSEAWDSTHSFPPTYGTGLKKPGQMNAGFFILAPSLTAFEYYKSLILDIPYSFDPRYPEQNLINYAHGWDGPMAWRELAYTWNIRRPNDQDVEKEDKAVDVVKKMGDERLV
ncbi:glycosyltransferase family 8 protein [Bipolaris maydis]|nr:glycosyltransferase family 8 protein [Bipolaris maydis]